MLLLFLIGIVESHLFGKELFIRYSVLVVRERLSICVWTPFPFWFEGLSIYLYASFPFNFEGGI